MKRENGRGGRPKRRPRHRPPFFAILLLSGFLLLALSFVTFRQIRAGEANRLRLLAGFAEQVEATVPELVTRFVNVVDQSKQEGTVSDRLEAVPNVVLVGGPLPPSQEEVQLQVKPDGEQIYLDYHTRLPPADGPRPEQPANLAALQRATEGDRGTGGGTPRRLDEGELVRFVGRLDLGPAIDPIVIPDVFDLIVLARQDGHEVLFQRGEPELKMGLVSSAWEVPGEGLLSGVTDLVTDDEDAQPSGGGTRVIEVEIAGADYRAFLQPVTLHLRDPDGNQLGTLRWVACGVISWERLLASSFSTSPVMLFLMVALFPILLATWPFLKLWLISPRQRFTRFDVAALLFSCVLALALIAYLLLDAAFMTRIQQTVDAQLRGIADVLAGALDREIDDVARQLETARDEITDPSTQLGALGLEEPESWQAIGDALPEAWTAGQASTGSGLEYPLLHSIFWADADGRQVYKVPFHPDSRLRNRIADRGYFRCALSMGDLHLRQAAGPRPCAGGTEGERRGCIEVCIESIRSKTTAEDVVAFAVPLGGGEDRETAGEPAADGDPDQEPPTPLRALVAVTRLASMSQALLPPGVSFAVVDAEGHVQFHSDSRRNASEDFSRAAGGDLLLASMISERRTGSLSINYWGERYRAFIQPIRNSPWSIVTLRNAGELRARNFELLFDFLNPFLPYLVTVCLALFGMLRWGRVRVVRYLWPARAYGPIYRAVFGAAPWIVGLFALAWNTGVPWLVVAASLLAPIAAVGIVIVRAVQHEASPRSEPSNEKLAVGRQRLWRSVPEAVSTKSWGYLLSGVPPVLATLYVAWTAPASRRPTAAVFFVITFGTWYLFQILRRSFVDKASTAPYVAAFTTVLVSVSVLPTIGLFRIAESRQTQLLVQETQIGLAEAEKRHDGRRKAETPPLANRLTGYDEYLNDPVERWRAETAAIAFGSVLGPDLSSAGDPKPTRWPFAVPADGSTASERAASEAPEEALPPPSNRRLARYLAARPVPLTDLAPDAAGTDLSRYGHAEGRWWRAPLTPGDRLRLVAGLPSHLDAGRRLLVVSDDPGDDVLEPVDAPRGVAVGIGWLLVISASGLFAYFIASRVLLVDLTPNHHQAKLEKILEFMKPDSSHPKRLLLIYPLPEAVVEMAAHGDDRPTWFHVYHFATRWDAAHDVDWRERDFLDPLVREEKEAAGRPERRTLLISDFRPNLEDPEIAKQQIGLLETLRRYGEGIGRSILIVTSRPYHRLARAADAPEEGLDDGAREARSWWSGYLARFSQRYGRDAGSDEHFCALVRHLEAYVRLGWWKEPDVSEWFEASSEAQGGDAVAEVDAPTIPGGASEGTGGPLKLSFTEVRRLLNLIEVIEHECRWTWRLQRIGIEILQEIQADLAEQRRRYGVGNGSLYLPTVTQLVSRIDFAATPYYQRVWDTCEWDEKLALHQLAQEGVVNPKSFDIALDLLNKGLVVRDVDKPALRLMNRSFREFVLRTVRRSHLLLWEQEEGFSAWEVWKWVLPLPLLLLGVFLFVTQQDAVSNVVGLLIALASLVPTGFNLYQHFQQMMTEHEAGSA